MGKITPGSVRTWNSSLAQRHPVAGAKAYRLMRQILATAVADELIARNPCLVKGAGQERSPERPVASIAEVDALAAAMPEPLRMAVLLAAWCQLRRAELLGLERRDIDLMHGTVRIERTANHLKGGLVLGPPKTLAGLRTLSVPPHLLPDLSRHLDAHVSADPGSPILAGPLGGRVRPDTLRKAWDDARQVVGRPDLHLHDLRHSGATWLGISGATTRELMVRVGHASPAAALRYQHATEDRDVALAHALSELAVPARVSPLSDDTRDIRGTGIVVG
jgi:integrase